MGLRAKLGERGGELWRLTIRGPRRATAAAGDQAVPPPPAVGDVFRFEGDRYTMVSLTPLRDPATGKVVMTGAEAQRDVERFGAGHYYRIRCNAAELVYSEDR